MFNKVMEKVQQVTFLVHPVVRPTIDAYDPLQLYGRPHATSWCPYYSLGIVFVIFVYWSIENCWSCEN